AAPTEDSSPSSPPSFEDLITEATNFSGDNENESLEVKAQKALECPCVADLRKGPCGNQFSEAFVCFIKSTAKEKGSDCVSPFIALQNCIKANPDAFSKDIIEDKTEDEEVQDYKIIPPSWSREPKPKGVSKL
ncbi:mitochondrial intermembrane space import and assembly protein 40 homolog, partial [Asparagus officinalis]